MPYETMEDIRREHAERIARAVRRDSLVEDVRATTAAIERFEREEADARKRAAVLEKIIALSRELPNDVVFDIPVYAGEASLAVQTIAGSALRHLNQLAQRRDAARKAAEARLGPAKKALTAEFPQ